MKKLSIFVVLLLAILSLCACGQSAQQETPAVQVLAPEERPVIFSAFSTKDLYGTAVDQTVFEGNTLTMVNIWGTFCSPCIKEMPELAEINREYADKGVAVIGIPADITSKSGVVNSAKFEEALSIIDATGADYLHIIPSKTMIEEKLQNCQSLPETIFLDSQGRQVGESYMGAKSKAEWIAIIDALLEAME